MLSWQAATGSMCVASTDLLPYRNQLASNYYNREVQLSALTFAAQPQTFNG